QRPGGHRRGRQPQAREGALALDDGGAPVTSWSGTPRALACRMIVAATPADVRRTPATIREAQPRPMRLPPAAERPAHQPGPPARPPGRAGPDGRPRSGAAAGYSSWPPRIGHA